MQTIVPRTGRRERSIPPLKGTLYSGKQTGLFKLKSSRDKPEIIEVFESAIGDAQGDHCIELLGNYRLDRVAANMGRREIQEGRVIGLNWPRCNDVPKADIYLNSDACSINHRACLDANTAIFEIFSDRRCRKPLGIKLNAIVWHEGRTDVPECQCQRLWTAITIAEEVQVPSRTEGIEVGFRNWLKPSTVVER